MSKVKLSELESLIVKLQKIKLNSKIKDKHRAFASSLLSDYMKYKSLTVNQKCAAFNLIKYAKPVRVRKPIVKKESYYLYAMTAGGKVKIGYTSNVKSRRIQIQTSNPDNVIVEWSMKCATTKRGAKIQERKLHRLCGDFRVGGEWFEYESLDLVKNFKVKNIV